MSSLFQTALSDGEGRRVKKRWERLRGARHKVILGAATPEPLPQDPGSRCSGWLSRKRDELGSTMTKFAFVVTKPDGSQAYEEDDFPLQAQAMEHAKTRVSAAECVRVGLLASGGVSWLGRWSNTPLPATWHTREEPSPFTKPQ